MLPSVWLVCIALGLYFGVLCAIIHMLFGALEASLYGIGGPLK
jgi:hypothetical protein